MVLYAVHDALVKPMPGGDNTPSLAESWTVVEGRADLRVRPAQGREVPQRRPGDGGGRQVLVRPLPRRRGQAPQGAGARGADRRSRPRALPAEGAVAGLHDLLRHLGHRRGVDRAEEVRREGRRRRLQEGADRRRAVQGRELHPGRRSGDGGVRGLLAQGPHREAARLPQHARRDDARRRAQGRRRGHRLSAERARGRRRSSERRGSAWPRRMPPGVVFLDLPEQWDPKSPWHDRRVRLAASHALDRNAPEPGRDARTLAADRRARPAGAGVRAGVYEPPAYDPARAKKLLAEAGLSQRASTRAT